VVINRNNKLDDSCKCEHFRCKIYTYAWVIYETNYIYNIKLPCDLIAGTNRKRETSFSL